MVGGLKPSEKYESQLGWLFPIYGKMKNVPNHQPVGVDVDRQLVPLTDLTACLGKTRSEPRDIQWLQWLQCHLTPRWWVGFGPSSTASSRPKKTRSAGRKHQRFISQEKSHFCHKQIILISVSRKPQWRCKMQLWRCVVLSHPCRLFWNNQETNWRWYKMI